ncbi:MAG: type II toxin-antitoxin system VapC family toxin [Candidatus Dormibacteria bacterium]
MTAVYIDSSALVKLVVPEAETASLLAVLQDHEEWLAAIVSVTEVMRATRRWVSNVGLKGRAATARINRAEEVLRSVALVDIDLSAVFRAGATEPVQLRSLDALHLAVALDLAAELDAFVTYDHRLAAAARTAGLTVVSPA